MVATAELGALAAIDAGLVGARNQISLMKPGIASFFMPNAGTHQAWMTSAAVSSKRTFVSTGTTSGLSTSSR